MHAESVATQVDGAEDLLAALLGDDLERMSQRGTEVWQRNTPPEALAAQLLGLMR